MSGSESNKPKDGGQFVDDNSDNTMHFNYQPLFSSDKQLESLALFEKMDGNAAKAKALREAKTRNGSIVGNDIRSYLEEYNAFIKTNNKSLHELEAANSFWSAGRNSTVLTTDLPKTILGGAK